MSRYLANIWRYRFFWLSLVKMDLCGRYRGSVLGLGWSLLHPIAMTAILCLVFRQAFHAELHRYAPFVLTGLACWHYLVNVTLQGCQCFRTAERYIRQHPAPMAIYPLRTALGASVHFLLALAIALVLAWCLRGFGNLAVLWCLVPAVGLLCVLGMSVAVVAGLVNVYFRDTRHICEVGIPLLFYTTPVMYEAKLLAGMPLGWLLDYHPLAAVLRLFRDPIIEATVPTARTFGVVGVTVLAATALATLCLMRLERKLVFAL
jgi:ABC-type polysaccharide/polyol phosphate export permease